MTGGGDPTAPEAAAGQDAPVPRSPPPHPPGIRADAVTGWPQEPQWVAPSG